jgi:acetyltransferase-like isoleucine patch superfamily enzyme
MRKNLKIWHPETCVISDDAEIGDDVIIHAGSIVYDDVKIGNRCHLEAQCFIPNGIKLGDDVFIGPGVKFCNDARPPSHGKCWMRTLVDNGAVIGAGAIILPGKIIGRNSMVAAGSVLTRNVTPGEVVMGNPARFYKLRKDL